ncbi:MAG: F0F1 ATP synthase subunit delta [Patescibacteria group bacterium]
MKYTILQYAAALASALEDKTPTERKHIAARLFRHMTKARALKHLDRVVRETGRMMRRKRGIRAAEVETPAPLSPSHRRSIERALGSKAIITEKINPLLLAGVRMVIDEETLIDATASRRLEILFSRTHS